jgi:hypothetical protein
MRRTLNFLTAAAMLAAAGLAAAPAHAAVVIDTQGNPVFTKDYGPTPSSVTYNFTAQGGASNALIPNMKATLTLTLLDFQYNQVTFRYSLLNSSTVTNTRVSGFGLNVDPNVSGAKATGFFEQAALDQSFASLGRAEVCVSDGKTAESCPQTPAKNALPNGDTATGSLILFFNNTTANPLTQVTLSNLLIRYQGFSTFNVKGEKVTSAVGSGTMTSFVSSVPEPATWAMMLLGFGMVGFAMRQRRRADLSLQPA